MRANPYIGPRSFRTGETLYGRDRELRRLLDLLIAERIVLLHAPSGAGKTSLVQAALVPALQAEGFTVLPPMRVSLEPPANRDHHLSALLGIADTPGTAPNRYVVSALLSLEEGLPEAEQLDVGHLATLSLSAYLDYRSSATPANDGVVLLFDQFEEILTVDPTDIAAKEEFFAQVGAALYDRGRWALFSMRDDYVGSIEPFVRPIPTQLANTFHLDLLDLKSALEAMQQPVRAAGAVFTDAAARQLADDLRRVKVMRSDGSTVEQLGPYLEPVQLQVVCYRLWSNLPDDDYSVDPEDVAALGNVDQALTGYYAERVAAIAAASAVSERAVREWCEHDLITEQGIRGQVLAGAARLDARAIAGLVDAHLVRGEKRRGAIWLELAHDRLIAPVKADNAAWREANLSPLQRQAALWERQARPDGLLFRDETLQAAERWAAANPEALTAGEQDFLAASQEARALVERERRATRRIRLLGIASAIAAVIAIVAALLAYSAKFAADDANESAQISQATAQVAQQEAVTQAAIAKSQTQLAEVRALLAQSAEAYSRDEHQSAALFAIEAFTRSLRDKINPTGAELALRRPLEQLQGSTLQASWRPIIALFDAGGEEAWLGVDDGGGIWRWARGDPQGRLLARIPNPERTLAQASARGEAILLSAGQGRTWLWRAAEPGEVRFLNALKPQQGLNDLADSGLLSPDGRWVLVSTGDGRLWRLDTSRPDEPLLLFGGDAAPAVNTWSGFAFTQDGMFLSIDEGVVWRWDISNPGSPPARVLSFEQGFGDRSLSPDGRRLALLQTQGDTTSVLVYNLEAPDQSPQSLPLNSPFQGELELSPDGRFVLLIGQGQQVDLWNTTRDDGVRQLRPAAAESTGRTAKSAFAPDSSLVAITLGGAAVEVWSTADPGAQPRVLRGIEPEELRFSHDQRYLAATGLSETPRVWPLDGDASAEPRVIASEAGYVKQIVVPAQTDEALLVGDGGGVEAVRLDGSAQRTVWAGGDQGAAVALSPDGALMVVQAADNSARLYRVADGAPLGAPSANLASRGPIRFSPDGTVLAISSSEHNLELWDIRDPASPSPMRAPELNTQPWVFGFSPDGASLAIAFGADSVRLWRLDDLDAQPTTLAVPADLPPTVPSAIALSPGGRYLALANKGGIVLLWDLPAGTLPRQLSATGSQDYSMVFSPDETWFAVGGTTGKLQLWSLPQADAASIELSWGVATALVFTERRLLSANYRGQLGIWHTDPAQLLAVACAAVGRNLTWTEWQQASAPGTTYTRTCDDIPIHESLVAQGRERVSNGDRAGGEQLLRDAAALQPDGEIDVAGELDRATAEGLIASVSDLVQVERYAEAIAALAQARALDPELGLDVHTLYGLCQGALSSAQVLPACEEAARDNPALAFFTAVARANADDLAGAAADLEASMAEADLRDEVRSRRAAWAAELHAGRNPFTAEVLKQLRSP